MQKYDLIIIGTGSGNTIITPEFDGLEIAIIEKGTFGGACLNRGCIPSKMLIYTADVLTEIAESKRLGISTEIPTINWTEIQSRIFGRIDPIANGGEEYRKTLPNVTVYKGEASFDTNHTIRVNGEIIYGDQIVVATGASPVVPAIAGLDSIDFHTSDSIMRIEELPKHLAIVGGGYIAAELAHVFSAFGSQVTMIVRGNSLLSQEDTSIQARFAETFSKRVNIRFRSRIKEVRGTGEVIVCEIEDTERSTLEVDALLIATGRIPDLEILNIKATDIETEDGYIITDDFMRTSVSHIWALGDVTNPNQLKHVANAEAKIVSHNIVNSNLKKIDLDPIPHAIFSSPQIASVGHTQQFLDRNKVDYVMVTEEFSNVAYGWAMEDTTGFCKIIADHSSGRLLGAHIIGPHATILIHLLIQGMKFNQTISDLAQGFLYVHPALSEVVENALLKAMYECDVD